MSALGVVKTLDIAEDAGLGLLTGLIDRALNLLGFERSEEAFYYRVVIAVAYTLHLDFRRRSSEPATTTSTRKT